MNAWLLTALLTGLASSLHCIGMCGPLALAVPVGRLRAGQRKLARGLYHAGRLAAYSTLGAVVGTVGQGIWLTGLQRPLALGAGLLLAGLALGQVGLVPLAAGSAVGGIGRRLLQPLARLLRQPTLWHLMSLGFLNGLLPCGTVYVALVGTLGTPSAVGGAVYMLFFGLGTLPALLSVQWVLRQASPFFRQQLSRALPLMTGLLALLLIGRGLGAAPPSARMKVPAPIPICHGR